MLNKFLQEKPLFYNEIDYTRMPRVYETIKSKIKIPKIIHLVGTNAKGTTGRFIASSLYSIGFNVGHYTSPHILEFNERIWLNGKNVSYERLEEVHKYLLSILSHEDSSSLSYFEYTTLLAICVYQECDYIILEAGLGGEYDATSVFENILTVVTPVDFDHESFLGTTISKIATTKLNAVKHVAIIAEQKYKEVYKIAKDIASVKNLTIYNYKEYVSSKDELKITKIVRKLGLVEYLEQNLRVSIATLNYLGVEYESKDFYNAKLFGRLSRLSENILLDVGHNPLAATAIVKSLTPNKYRVIYNSYKDKDYKTILEILKPIVEEIEIIKVNEDRIEETEVLKKTIEELGLKCRDFQSISLKNNYLVFGSFSVSEVFLKEYYNG